MEVLHQSFVNVYFAAIQSGSATPPPPPVLPGASKKGVVFIPTSVWPPMAKTLVRDLCALCLTHGLDGDAGAMYVNFADLFVPTHNQFFMNA